MENKKIVFLTGTRADFGKQKSLIEAAHNCNGISVYIFVTGMHLLEKYGNTFREIKKSGFDNIYPYINQSGLESMDLILANTIQGFSQYIHEVNPNMIVVHGDRVEALAGAIVGALNNISVCHIEGGEISGTIDELIRHAVSKLSHIHLVANDSAKRRLLQMGEKKEHIFPIGSPDIDIMFSRKLKSLNKIKKHYDIDFKKYAILIFHPVTTEIQHISEQASNLVNAVIESGQNYIVIYPNNDLGSDIIMDAYKKFTHNHKIKIFPSIRFEYFIVLLKNSEFILGNSSSGIREAPYHGVPTINIGSRQNGRALSKDIIFSDNSKEAILSAINKAKIKRIKKSRHFGLGKSSRIFMNLLKSKHFWEISKQKYFQDFKPF